MLSLALYVCLHIYGDTKPFTMSQLFLWADSLDREYRVAVLSSLITVIGFLVAFATARQNALATMRTEYRLSVANELNDFFDGVLSAIRDAEIYVDKQLVEVVNKLQAGMPLHQGYFQVDYTMKNLDTFLDARTRLLSASVAVHGITGKHYVLFTDFLGVPACI